MTERKRTPTRLLAPKVINSYDDLRSLLVLSFEIYKFTYENPQSLFSTDVNIPQYNLPSNVAVYFKSKFRSLSEIQGEMDSLLQSCARWRGKDSEVELFANFLDPDFGIDGLVFFLEVWGRLYSHFRNTSSTRSPHFLRELRLPNDVCRHLASLIFDSRQLPSVRPSFWKEKEKSGATNDGSVFGIVFLKRALAEFQSVREVTSPRASQPSPSMEKSASLSPRRHPLSNSEVMTHSPPSPPESYPFSPTNDDEPSSFSISSPPSSNLQRPKPIVETEQAESRREEEVERVEENPNPDLNTNPKGHQCLECQKLKENVAVLTAEIEQNKSFTSDLADKLGNLEARMDNKDDTKEEETVERLSLLENLINELVEWKEGNESELKTIKTKFSDVQSSLTMIEEFSQSQETIQQQVNNLESKVSGLVESVEMITTKSEQGLTEVFGRLDVVDLEFSQFKTQNAELSESFEDFSKSISEQIELFTTQIQTIQHDLDQNTAESKEDFAELRTSLSSELEGLSSSLKDTLVQMKEQVVCSEEKMKGEVEGVRNLVNEIGDKKVNLEDYVQSVDTINETINTINQEVSDSSSLLTGLIDGHKQSFDGQLSELNDKVLQVQEDFTRIQNLEESINSQFKDSERVLISVVDNRTEAAQTKLLEALDGKLEESSLGVKGILNESNEKLSDSIDALTIRTHAVREEAISLHTSLQESINDVYSRLEEISQAQEELTADHSDFEDAEPDTSTLELKESIQLLMNDVEGLRSQVSQTLSTTSLQEQSQGATEPSDPIELGALALRIDSLEESFTNLELSANSIIRESIKRESVRNNSQFVELRESLDDLQEQFNQFVQLNAALVKQMEADSTRISQELKRLEENVKEKGHRFAQSPRNFTSFMRNSQCN
ncbi:hypothetical protein P9112_011549 [Eukaryota sp. TZLM1-RC]